MYICKNNSDYLQNIINSIKSFIKQKKNVESPKGKILIVGESSVSIRHIEKSIKELGFALKRFEFILGYDEIKKFSFDKIFNNPDYAVILASAMPHITINSNGYSSTISSISRTSGYPLLIKLGTNGLKLTKSNLTLTLRILLNFGFLSL